MAERAHWTLFAAGLVLAGAALAQPGANPAGTYPNTSAFGMPFDHAAPWYQQCLRVNTMAAPATPRRPASCKAFDYYDKLSQADVSQAEWNDVRACAVDVQNDAVLSMLFANGLGVARNLDLATRYACRAGGAYAEVTARIAHLQTLKTSATAARYDQCDDITSGYMGVICAGIAEGQAGKVRRAFIARLRRQLPAAQQTALDRLASAAGAYARARQGEVDMQGTSAPQFALEAEVGEQEWLREHLANFEKGTFDLSPAQELPEDDRELNRLYGLVMAAPATDPARPDRLPGSTVKKADVRAAQRLWLAYRDAWVRFAALRYPAVAADAIKVELTTWRAQQLRALAASAD